MQELCASNVGYRSRSFSDHHWTRLMHTEAEGF